LAADRTLDPVTDVLAWARDLPIGWVVLLALAENAMLLVAALGLGGAMLRLPTVVRLMPDPGRVSRLQVWLAVGAVVGNSAVTVAGWWLWRAGVIHVGVAATPWIALDLVLLTLVMDLFMYVGHAIAHLPRVFGIVHALHHRFVDARPLTLFALHPLEVLGFGALWLVALVLHTFSLWAIAGYTVLNLVFGVFGHLGVEVLPARLRRSPVFTWVATPTLHVGHHAAPAYNLGFYTTIWDRLFGTLEPSYDRRRCAARPQPYAAPVG
jgi:sterol desaturase/sphingolipid hydroxylase (fatty acid hydroxylase superfamily)